MVVQVVHYSRVSKAQLCIHWEEGAGFCLFLHSFNSRKGIAISALWGPGNESPEGSEAQAQIPGWPPRM